MPSGKGLRVIWHTNGGFPSLAVIHGQLSLPTLMNQRVQNFLFTGVPVMGEQLHLPGTTRFPLEKRSPNFTSGWTPRTPLPSHIHPMWFPNGMTRVVLATMRPVPPAQPRDPPPLMVSMPLPLDRVKTFPTQPYPVPTGRTSMLLLDGMEVQTLEVILACLRGQPMSTETLVLSVVGKIKTYTQLTGLLTYI